MELVIGILLFRNYFSELNVLNGFENLSCTSCLQNSSNESSGKKLNN